MMSEDEPCKGSRVPTEEKAVCVMVPKQERVRKESWQIRWGQCMEHLKDQRRGKIFFSV